MTKPGLKARMKALKEKVAKRDLQRSGMVDVPVEYGEEFLEIITSIDEIDRLHPHCHPDEQDEGMYTYIVRFRAPSQPFQETLQHNKEASLRIQKWIQGVAPERVFEVVTEPGLVPQMVVRMQEETATILEEYPEVVTVIWDPSVKPI